MGLIQRIKQWLMPSKTRTVLVVDDSRVDRTYLARCLFSRYNVMTAVDGREGLELAISDLPDLIILDHEMPGMKGPEVCRELKKNDRTKDIPVIFLTAIDTPGTVLGSYAEDAAFFLTKPVGKGELLKLVGMRLAMPLLKQS